jgi:purine-binding chemotaxis protein CheW
MEVLAFEVAGQLYGVQASDVEEILRAVSVVPLPKAPAVIEGVINLRGSAVPVLDVRRRFRLPAKGVEHTDHLIVAHAGERLVALHVDRATGLVQLGPADVDDATGVVPGVEYVRWVARLPESLVLIHDLPTFLSRAEADALEEALPAGGQTGREE